MRYNYNVSNQAYNNERIILYTNEEKAEALMLRKINIRECGPEDIDDIF